MDRENFHINVTFKTHYVILEIVPQSEIERYMAGVYRPATLTMEDPDFLKLSMHDILSLTNRLPDLIDAKSRLRKSFENILEEKGDPETDHLDADKALIQFVRDMGLNDVAEQFENLNKWYA